MQDLPVDLFFPTDLGKVLSFQCSIHISVRVKKRDCNKYLFAYNLTFQIQFLLKLKKQNFLKRKHSGQVKIFYGLVQGKYFLGKFFVDSL